MRYPSLAIVLVLAAAAAYGGTARSAPLRSNDTTLTLRAVGAIAYDKKALRARVGKVTITMRNASPLKHDVAIRGNGARGKKGKIVGTGGTSTAVAQLKRGRFTFYCSVPGHEEAGMKGTLTVS